MSSISRTRGSHMLASNSQALPRGECSLMGSVGEAYDEPKPAAVESLLTTARFLRLRALPCCLLHATTASAPGLLYAPLATNLSLTVLCQQVDMDGIARIGFPRLKKDDED